MKISRRDMEVSIKLCIDYIKSRPFRSSNDVILTCNIDNSIAIHIYEKIGFKIQVNVMIWVSNEVSSLIYISLFIKNKLM